jgi:hypothetical protein
LYEPIFLFSKEKDWGSCVINQPYINLREIYGAIDILIETITHEILHALIFEAIGPHRYSEREEEIVEELD